MLEDRKLEAQSVLKNLLREGLIPFELNVGSLLRHGPSTYRVLFFDSRMHSVEFYCSAAQDFKKAFRTAVLERVAKLSGPLARPGPLPPAQGKGDD